MGILSSLPGILALLFIVIVIIVFVRLINGPWILKDGPAISIKALVTHVTLNKVDKDGNFTQDNGNVYVAKPSRLSNLYTLDTVDGNLIMSSDRFQPGMTVMIDSRVGSSTLEIDDESIDLNQGMTVFVVDEDGDLSIPETPKQCTTQLSKWVEIVERPQRGTSRFKASSTQYSSGSNKRAQRPVPFRH